MDTLHIVVYSIALVLNVFFGWLGSRWITRKGYPEYGWVVWLACIISGFVLPLIVVSLIPGRGRPVKRRPLRRKLPQARMPEPRSQG